MPLPPTSNESGEVMENQNIQKILGHYIILGGGIQADRVDQLLGRVVKSVLHPIQSMAPGFEIVPEQLVPEIKGNEIVVDAVTESSQENRNDSGRVQLTKLVRAQAKLKEGNTATVSAYLLKSYDMVQIGPNFEKLMQDEKYREAVQEIYARTQADRLPMITKVLICDEMEIKTIRDSTKGAGVDLTAPITAAATHGAVTEGPLDASLQIEHENVSNVARQKKLSGKIIVALAYSWTIRQPVPKQRQKKQGLFKRLMASFAHKDADPKMEIIVSEDPKEPIYLGAAESEAAETVPNPGEDENDDREKMKVNERDEGSASEQTIHENDEVLTSGVRDDATASLLGPSA
ncbi:hypothetical protein BDZ45DRAFT_679666 [Acephala macrosclerotiorum]|nr:hypothetical protein BDZ45DRAFT_679666 [Acephala macrosclerotiorum]